MKFLLSLLFIVTAPAFSQDCTNCSQDSDQIENCKILNPNTNDNNRQYCPGTSFGVTYNGYLATSKCYSSIREAMFAMRLIRACRKVPKRGNCKILNPNTNDNNRKFCPGTSFGITYNGYLATGKCYDSVDKAMDIMESTSACFENDKLNSCAILYPNKHDNNFQYCPGTSFGVTYKGILASPKCYETIDEAIYAMKEINY